MSGPSADFVAEKDTETRVKAQRESFEGRRLQRDFPSPSVFRSSFSDRPTALRVKLNRGGKKETRETRSEGGGERAISAMEADEWP